MAIKTKNFKIRLSLHHGLGLYYGLPTDEGMCHLKLNQGIVFLKDLGFNLDGTIIDGLGANFIIQAYDIADFIRRFDDPDSVNFKGELHELIVDLMRISLMIHFNNHDKNLVNSFKKDPIRIFKALAANKNNSINPNELAKSRPDFKSKQAYQKYWLKEFPFIKDELSDRGFNFLKRIKVTESKSSAEPKINLKSNQIKVLTSFYNQLKILSHKCWINHKNGCNHLIAQQYKNEFIQASDDLGNCFKLSITDEDLIQIIADSMEMPDGFGPKEVRKYRKFIENGGYICLKEAGVGCPSLKTKQDLATANVILRLYHREAEDISNIHELVKDSDVGKIKYKKSKNGRSKNKTSTKITKDYFKIKKISLPYRHYGKLWLQNHPVTVKQFKNLALLFGELVPNYSILKNRNLNTRLINFISLITVNYTRASASSYRQIIYDPLKDENHGQYIKNDDVAKMLLRILNPDLGSYQIKELFDRLISFLPIKCQKFHQHPSDQNIIAYRNGLLNRPSRTFRPITAKDKIIPKLDTNLNQKYVKLVPTKELIKKYGFKDLVIKLATDYQSKNDKWHQLEYPFSQMNYLNKQIQKFNPFKYIYFLANKDTTRTVTLFQVLLSNIQTNYAHDSLMLLNSTGKRGKSTFLDIVQNIVGKAAVSHVSIQDLGNTSKPFAASSMLGSVATVNNETTSSGFLKDDSILKQLVSHEEMDVPEKYQNPIRTNFPFMAYTGATNNGLKIHGDAEADSRRITMVQFKNKWITKYGTSDFRKVVIDSRPVTLWFAAFVGLCVPNFTKFTVCSEDLIAKQEQTTGTDTVFTFIKNELIPELRKNRRDYALRPTFDSPVRTKILANIPKVIVFDWYVNYTRQTGGKAVGSTKFIKQLRQGLNMPNLVPSNTMKLAQRTVTKGDAIGYAKLADDDKYMPKAQGRKLKTDDFGKAVGKRKRCLCISYDKPLFSGTLKDKESAKPLKKKLDAINSNSILINFVCVGLKDNKKAPTLGVSSVQNGLAEVVGNIEIHHKLYYTNCLWIRVSKLNLKGESGKASSIKENILRKDSQKLIKNFRKQLIKNIFNDNEDPTECKLDLKSAYQTAKNHDSYESRIADFKDLFMKLYLASDKQLLIDLFNLKFKSEVDKQCVPRISSKMKVRYQRQRGLDCQDRYQKQKGLYYQNRN